jgi:hypothetical protein
LFCFCLRFRPCSQPCLESDLKCPTTLVCKQSQSPYMYIYIYMYFHVLLCIRSGHVHSRVCNPIWSAPPRWFANIHKVHTYIYIYIHEWLFIHCALRSMFSKEDKFWWRPRLLSRLWPFRFCPLWHNAWNSTVTAWPRGSVADCGSAKDRYGG